MAREGAEAPYQYALGYEAQGDQNSRRTGPSDRGGALKESGLGWESRDHQDNMEAV
jgi:hypothetical protein